MNIRVLIIRYAAFSAIATIANLAAQRAVLSFGTSATIFSVAIGIGTIVGLFIKYLLDKRWIFYDIGNDLKDNSIKFTLYSCMGLVTTAIFWGAETTFWLMWQTDNMREIGAILGLSVGYLVKYNLDRRFVFTDRRLAPV